MGLFNGSTTQASKDGYEEKQKELEGIAYPIMQKLFGVAGGSAGGALGDFSGVRGEKGLMCGRN
jgi:heat shock protein 1/8